MSCSWASTFESLSSLSHGHENHQILILDFARWFFPVDFLTSFEPDATHLLAHTVGYLEISVNSKFAAIFRRNLPNFEKFDPFINQVWYEIFL